MYGGSALLPHPLLWSVNILDHEIRTCMPPLVVYIFYLCTVRLFIATPGIVQSKAADPINWDGKCSGASPVGKGKRG